jgi:hypothetical protein
MKKSRRLAMAFFERFKKKPLPPSWNFNQPRIKSGTTGGFDRMLKKDTVKPEAPAPKKQEPYKSKRLRLKNVAIRRIYGKHTG